MGIEINFDKMRKLGFQAEQPEANVSVSGNDVEIGAEMNGVTEGYADVAEFSRKKSEVPLTAEQTAAKAISDKLRKDDNLRPATLKEFLDKNVSDSELRAEADKCIAELDGMKNEPEKYLKEYKKAKDGSLRKEILEVYIKEERAKALEEFGGFFAKAAMTDNNYTVILNSYKGGAYFDENGKIKIKPNFKMTPYQEEALYKYTTEVMPYEMDARFRAALLAMEKDGTLNSYESDSDFAKAVMEKAGVKGTDPKFEQYVKNRKDLSKLAERHDKIMKRREELKHVSEKEINKKLKESTRESIKDYMETHFVEEKDGVKYYDLSEISVAMEGCIGKDFYVNRYDDDNKTLWEVEQVRTELRARRTDAEGKEYYLVKKSSFDKEEGDSKQTEDLIDFCGYEFEPKNHVPSILEAAKGLAEGAVGGLLVHVAAPQINHLHVAQTVVIRDLYESLSLDDFIDMFGSIDINAINIDDEANIIINQLVDMNLLWKNVVPAMGYGALWGLVAHAATEAIFGREIACEMECFNKSRYDIDESRYTKKADFETFLKDNDESGTTYNKVKFLLDKYPAKADGTWDHAHFFNDLRKIAGLGSNLNCLEMAGAKMYPDEPKAQPVSDQPIKIITSKETKRVPDKLVTEKINEYDLDGDNKITFNKKAKSSSWTHLAQNVYDCAPDGKSLADVFGLSKAIRILKIAQAITDGDYSRERLEDLYNKSLKGASKLKNIDGVDYNVYYSMLTGNFPQSIKLPKELAGIIRCNVSEDEHELIAPKAKDQNGPKSAINPANGIKVTTKTIKGYEKTSYYIGKDKGGYEKCESEEDQQAKVSQIQEVFPDTEVENVENIEEFRKRAQEEPAEE